MRRWRIATKLGVIAFAFASPAHATPRFESTDRLLLAPLGRPDGVATGVSMGDVDGDGDDDLLLVRARDGITLFRSEDGALALRDPNPVPRFFTEPWRVVSVGASDVDGDGHVDLVTGGDGAFFLRGNGNGSFVDATPLAFDGAWQDTGGITIADVDGDGLLDVYLVGDVRASDWPHVRCDRDALFLQRPFDAWREVPLPDAANDNATGCGFGAVVFDADGDSDADLFVVNDFAQHEAPWHLWRQGELDPSGNVTLSDAMFVAAPIRTYGMGASLGDLDGDGALDLATTSIGYAPVLRGNGTGTFVDEADRWGLGGALGKRGYRVTWGAWINDVDGDGTTDVIESGGLIPSDPALSTFAEASPTWWVDGSISPRVADGSMFDHWLVSGVEYRAFATGDADRDGAPDLAFATSLGGPPAFLRNRTGADTAWLAITPRGAVSPREARGAIVTLQCPGQPARVSVVPTGGNAASLGAPRAFLSRANCDLDAATLTIDWPSGIRTRENLPRDPSMRRLDVDEPRWLDVDRAWLVTDGDDSLRTAHISLTPRDANGAMLGAGHDVRIETIAGSVSVDSVIDGGDGSYSTDAHATGNGDIWLRIRIDGRVMPRRIRLDAFAAPAATRITAAPRTIAPSRGSMIGIVPRRSDGSPFGPGISFVVNVIGGHTAGPLEDLGDGSYLVPVVPEVPVGGSVRVRPLLPDGAVPTRDFVVAEPIDRVRSHLEMHWMYGRTGSPAPTLLTGIPLFFDAQGRPAAAISHELRIEHPDGTPIDTTLAGAPGRESLTLRNPGALDEDWLVRVDGVPLAQRIRYRTDRDDAGMRAALDPMRSRIRPLQSTLRADGVDTTRVVWMPRDADGHGVPYSDLQWDVTGGSIDATSVEVMAGGAYSFRFRSGETPGIATVHAHVADLFEASTTITLLAPPEPVPIDHMDVCVAGVGSPGASTVSLFLRIAPRDRDGVLVGGARDVTATAEGTDVPLIYRVGEYLATVVVPSDRATTTVSAIDRGSRLPARATSPLGGRITVPSQLLAATTIGTDPWFGEERCAIAGGSPDGGGSDGGDAAIDASAGDANGFDASDASRGDVFVPPAVNASGGCACRVGNARGSHARSAWLGVLIVVGAVGIRRRTDRGAPVRNDLR